MNTGKMGLTIEEAAECTGIGRNTMRKLVDWGKLPVLKVGRKAIIRRDTLERFMAVNQGICFRRMTSAGLSDPLWRGILSRSPAEKGNRGSGDTPAKCVRGGSGTVYASNELWGHNSA